MSQYRSSMVFATSRSFKSDVLGLFSMSPRNAGPCLTHQRPPATSLKWTELAVNVQTQNIVTHLSMPSTVSIFPGGSIVFIHLYICTSMLTHTHTHANTHGQNNTTTAHAQTHVNYTHTHILCVVHIHTHKINIGT